MRSRMLGFVVIGGLLAGVPTAALAQDEPAVLQDFESSVRYMDPATGELVHVPLGCDVLVRVQQADGSATEWQACVLLTEPDDGATPSPATPATPATPADGPTIAGPATPVVEVGGECAWYSDYQANQDGSFVSAASYELVITPSGHAYIRTTYPAEPIVCPDA